MGLGRRDNFAKASARNRSHLPRQQILWADSFHNLIENGAFSFALADPPKKMNIQRPTLYKTTGPETPS